MELISRQAVLDLAFDMAEIDGEHFDKPFMVVDTVDIELLPFVNPQKWIPASKAPSEDGKHLVVCKSIGMGCNLMYIANYAKDLSSVDEYDFENEQRGGWYDYDSECGYFEISDVIAYMPLPPYKGVEE